MNDIHSSIKLKNPEDVTRKVLDSFRHLIETTQRHLNELQSTHRELTGRDYVLPVRL